MKKCLLLLVFIVALFIRIFGNYYFQGIDSPQDTDFPDYVAYHSIADALAHDGYFGMNGQITTRFPPGVPFLLAGIIKLFGDSPLYIRIFYSLLGALTCVGVYYLAFQLFENWLFAFTSSFILALYPPHFYWSMHFGTEVPLLLFVTLFLIYFVKFVNNREKKELFISAILLSFCIHIHPGYIFYLFVLFLLTFLKVKKIGILNYTTFFGVVLILLIPWTFRNSIIQGGPAFLSTHGGSTFWDGNNPITFNDERFLGRDTGTLLREIQSEGLESDIKGFQEFVKIEEDSRKQKIGISYSAIKYVSNNLNKLPKVILFKMIRAFDPVRKTNNKLLNLVFTITYCVSYVFQAIGVAFVVKNRKYFTFFPLAAQYLTFVSISSLFFGLARYRLFLMPAEILLISFGIFYFFNKFYNGSFIKNVFSYKN